MSLLITHSLLNSWQYALSPMMDSDDPWQDFLTVLCREHTQPSEAMQKGIDFENLVMDIVNGQALEPDSWYGAASKIAQEIKGGVYQYKAMRTEQIGGTDFLLYGRLDVLKAGEIMDIKYSGSYERGKFYGFTQHPFYFELIPEAQTFSYLVSNGIEVWTETYRRDETRDIKPLISDFAEWLRNVGLWDEYEKHWRARQ